MEDSLKNSWIHSFGNFQLNAIKEALLKFLVEPVRIPGEYFEKAYEGINGEISVKKSQKDLF